jgi:hypothetical protein
LCWSPYRDKKVIKLSFVRFRAPLEVVSGRRIPLAARMNLPDVEDGSAF